MKKYYLSFIIIITISTNIISQNIWKLFSISEEDFQLVSSLGIDSLQNIIIKDKWDSDPLLYRQAAEYLLNYHSDTHTQFLLNNLNTVIDTTRTDMFSLLQWDKYFIDTYIKGILGDPSSMSRMDTIAQFCPKSNIKVAAIRKLAEAGYYDYWVYINSRKEDIDAKVVFFMYGEDQRYKSYVLNYLENQIQNIDPNDWSKIVEIAGNIGDLDSIREIEIIDNYFRSTTGETRKYYFDRLNIIDQVNQPYRSMWVIPLEPDEFLRSTYIPIMLEERTFLEAEGYYSPTWIHFMEEWLPNESSSLIKGHIEMNIIDFKPLKPDTISSIENNMDYTKSLIDTVYNYTWLGDQQFKDELQSILQSAQSNLQTGDSLACRVQVQAFQDLVDIVFNDSLNTDPRFVTIEGWKFLYWNAQYILDRLPEPPVVVTLSLEVINPAMSLVNPGAFSLEIKGTGFTTNSVVYFNGNARATTFVSDSTLNAQILSTDVSVAGNYPVWVTEVTTNSDTLTYRVVSTLPQPVRPVLECVRNNGDGTYTANFGYKNDNDVSVYIPIGNRNKFTPTPQDRGQTRIFLPGRKYRVFTVNFNGSNLVWTLNGRTSTASSNSAPCQ
ncbi:IPT/TIG domain-containing protein [Schleiferia thermophila]